MHISTEHVAVAAADGSHVTVLHYDVEHDEGQAPYREFTGTSPLARSSYVRTQHLAWVLAVGGWTATSDWRPSRHPGYAYEADVIAAPAQASA